MPLSSSELIKGLLLRALISPLFLRASEGRRFLSSLFGLHLPFISELHAAIKAQVSSRSAAHTTPDTLALLCPALCVMLQLPNSRASLIGHYGEIYFRAWRFAEGQLLMKIGLMIDCVALIDCSIVEYDCIQSLMSLAVHAAHQPTAKALRTLLHVFHQVRLVRQTVVS